MSFAVTRRSMPSFRLGPRSKNWLKDFCSPKGRSGRLTVTCSSAIPTTTPFIAGRTTTGCPCSAPRAATLARTSPNTASQVRTDWRSTARASDHQRAWQPPSHATGEERHAHRARRPLRGQAAQQPERPRLPLRRRPSISPIRRSVCPSSSTTRGRKRRSAASSMRRRQAPAVEHRPERPQRYRLLAGRKISVCRQLGREAESHHALRGHARRHAGERHGLFDMTSAPGEDALDGMKVDIEGQSLRVWAGRYLDHFAERHNTSARSSRRSILTTSRGVVPMERRSTSQRKRGYTESASVSWANGHSTRRRTRN